MELLQQLTKIALQEKEELHKGHNGDLVSYLFVKGDLVRHAENQACYYQVENGAPWEEGITGIISSLNSSSKPKEDVIRKWLEFHTNDPVFGQSILSKDIDWMLEHKLVIHDTSAPGNLMQGVMVSIRQLWEYDQIVNSYYELEKSGINKTLAYNLAHYLRVCNEDTFEFSTYGPGHNLFYGSRLTIKHLQNWLNSKMGYPFKPYIQASKYSGTSNMFDAAVQQYRNGDLEPWVKDWIRKIIKPKQAKVTTNPFGKAKAGANKNVYSVDELNKALKKNEKAMIKEIMKHA